MLKIIMIKNLKKLIMIINKMRYSYNDIAIVPAIVSFIEHRNNCWPFWEFTDNTRLPIFTAPMSTVVNESNFELFSDNHIFPILPRNISLETRIQYLKEGKWAAVGLNEFYDLFIKNQWKSKTITSVVIDIANGHMQRLIEYIKHAKNTYDAGIQIMCGNIANPETFRELAKAGADYVRVGIGVGSGCTTWSNVGIGYPIASLIHEIYKIAKTEKGKVPYIIADGGIRNYSDVIKALALGADFVMIGSEFAKLVESAAPTFYYKKDKTIVRIDPLDCSVIGNDDGTFIIDSDTVNLYKLFYGMASKQGQIDLNGSKTRTSEGISKVFECTTNLSTWVENMCDYLKSAMSYVDVYDIQDFNPENVDCVVISQQTKESINQ